jgi:micrococcal nuclease
MKRTLLALVLLLPSCKIIDWSATEGRRGAPRPPDYDTPVYRVIDGDTIVTGQGTVRLIGVDTPETHHPTVDVEPCGPEAEAFTRAQLHGKHVHLVTTGYDRYGRVLAYVYDRKVLFNLKLIEQGWSPAYDRYKHALFEDFKRAEAKAKAEQRGLWNPTGCNRTATP